MTSTELNTKALNLGELKLFLEKEYPYLTRQPYTFAVNEVLTRDLNHPIKNEDTIALLPPFSGG